MDGVTQEQGLYVVLSVVMLALAATLLVGRRRKRRIAKEPKGWGRFRMVMTVLLVMFGALLVMARAFDSEAEAQANVREVTPVSHYPGF